MPDTLERLRAILAEVTDLNRATAVLAWDQETYMPPGGVQNRAEQFSTLSEVAHRRFTSEEVGRLLDDAEGANAKLDFDSDEASLIRVTRRDYDQARKLPSELVAEIAHASSTARPHWQKARHESNFGLFAPYLEKNVELNRRVADALGFEKRPYDALLNRTEPGLTTDELEAIFDELKTAIVPLVSDISRRAEAVDDSVLRRGFDPDRQLSYALDTVTKLGYDLERGRQDISTHPFSIAFGPGDVRITTRVNRDFFNECRFGSIHEAGHGMYFQGIGRNLDRTNLWDGASPGVHESQSRLWENLVGRSLPFWNHFFRACSGRFPSRSRASMPRRSTARSTSRTRRSSGSRPTRSLTTFTSCCDSSWRTTCSRAGSRFAICPRRGTRRSSRTSGSMYQTIVRESCRTSTGRSSGSLSFRATRSATSSARS